MKPKKDLKKAIVDYQRLETNPRVLESATKKYGFFSFLKLYRGTNLNNLNLEPRISGNERNRTQPSLSD
jgi:hypothetical protein